MSIRIKVGIQNERCHKGDRLTERNLRAVSNTTQIGKPNKLTQESK